MLKEQQSYDEIISIIILHLNILVTTGKLLFAHKIL